MTQRRPIPLDAIPETAGCRCFELLQTRRQQRADRMRHIAEVTGPPQRILDAMRRDYPGLALIDWEKPLP